MIPQKCGKNHTFLSYDRIAHVTTYLIQLFYEYDIGNMHFVYVELIRCDMFKFIHIALLNDRKKNFSPF